MANEPVGLDDLPDPDVVACGAVVLRKGAVLLVHRPKYDDWSFPKGKRDPGEEDPATAVREVLEETGVEIRLGMPLTSMAYRIRGGTKIVHYWRGIVVGDPDLSDFRPNREIDQVRWVPVAKATGKLSYERDRRLLDEAVENRAKTRTLIIARHAKAQPRKEFQGSDDRLRPLHRVGAEQSVRLGPILAAYGVTTLISSDSVRCVQTFEPYAEEQVIGLTKLPCLSEELVDDKLIEQELAVLMSRPESAAVCTHRPVLPLLFDGLGITMPPLRPADLVIIHHRNGKILAAEHLSSNDE